MSFKIIKSEPFKLVFELKGNEINRGLTNAIRRISLSEIPTCAFDKVKIYKNTSNWNNTNVETTLSNFIIRQEIKLDDKLTLNISVKNNENKMMYLSPDIDFQFYLNENKIDLHKKYTYAKLLPLKMNQELRLTAEINIDIETTHAKYAATIPYIYIELNDNHFKIGIESRGQLTSKDILLRTFEIMSNKLKKLKNIVNGVKDEDIKKDVLEFSVENENSTLGGILANYFYRNKNIEKIAYKYIDNLNVLYIFVQGIDLKINIVTEIEYILSIIEKLYKYI
jgi:DNA-directed RNA polymerase subunit D